MDQHTNKSMLRRWMTFIMYVILIYLLPLIFVYFDDFVFKTHWFAMRLPMWCSVAFCHIYPFSEMLFALITPDTQN